MKRAPIILLAALLAAGHAALAGQPFKGGPYVGTVELKETLVAPLESERLVSRPAKEGMRVNAGDAIARLDTALLESEAARLGAEVSSREAKLKELNAGSRVERIHEASAERQAAETRLALARTERSRAEKLLASGAGGQAALDRARSQEESAAREVDAAAARLALLEAGERSEQRDLGRSELEASRQARDLVRMRIERMTLRAPAVAVVLDTYYEVGEVVPAGRPVVKLGDASAPYVDIYVAPEDLSALTIGSRLPVKVDGFDGRTFDGAVSEMGAEAEFTPRAILTPRERARLVYRVRVTIEDASGDLRPGVPAEVAGP
jgi:HlyD family secretion protein